MEQKQTPTTPSNNTSDAFSGKSSDSRTPTPSSSAAVRKDVDRAMGNASDAADKLKDTANEKVQEVKGSVVDGAEDAKADVARVADKVQQTGQKAIEATSAYATNAVNATGQKVREVQDRIDGAKTKANDFIQEDPVRAVTYAAIGSAVLTAALIGIFRRR
ncbi:MAG: YtxH domain-containing protein [Oxalobacteraceae bacterium]|nr:MAG: YtxH domain-containing protein [Oxalobacteraceae bacterium]